MVMTPSEGMAIPCVESGAINQTGRFELNVDRPRTRTTILLASTSPRRRDLLQKAGIEFQVETAQTEELAGGIWTARELCLLNAERKAMEVGSRFPERIVLGADTVVCFEQKVFGKPGDLQEARSMLEQLCGRVHEVLTGVCLLQKSARKLCRFVESTHVRFRSRDAVDLEDYLKSIHPLDKAGGYAAQEDQGRLIECIEGSMSNVIGLPVERVLAVLNKHF
jgi:septum formation protein